MKRLILLLIIFQLSTTIHAECDRDSSKFEQNNKINISRNTLIKNYNLRSNRRSPIREFGAYPNPFFTLRLGGSIGNINARISANSDKHDIGTTINLENDLGFNSKVFMPNADAYFRLGKRHQVVLSYTGFSKERTNTITRNINYKNSTFIINNEIKSKFHFYSYSADYRYSIIRKPVGELGVSLGARLFDLYGRISGNLNQISYSESQRVYAPVPFPGIHGSVYLTKFLLLRAKVEYFKLSLNKWGFDVLDIKPSIEFYPFENFGIGAAYSYFNIGIMKVPSEELDGEFRYKLNSASLFLCYRM